MENSEMLKTTTPQEKELITMVLERAREKAKRLLSSASEPHTQQKRDEGYTTPYSPSYSQVGGI